MAVVLCPACSEELELDDAYRDWTVRCPHCNHEFTPSDPNRTEDDSDDHDDRYDDGAEFVYGHDGSERQEALDAVAAPAIWLEICGWAGVIILGLACALMVLLAVAEVGNPGGGDDAIGFLFMTCCAGIVGLPYSLVIAIGGRHMRTLGSRGWAMTAAILGIVMFVLLGFCGVLHTAIGIWALVVLEKPVVRRAFGADQPRRRRRDRDW